jgi:hypothetical protein
LTSAADLLLIMPDRSKRLAPSGEAWIANVLVYKGEAKAAIDNRDRTLSALAERAAHDSDAALTISKGGEAHAPPGCEWVMALLHVC